MTQLAETFRNIPISEYYSAYMVSDHGNIWSIKRRIVLRTCLRNGYMSVCLSYDNTKKNFLVHRLVALAFIENPNGNAIVNHKDGNKCNNHYTNLEWVTASDNAKHSVDTLHNTRPGVSISQFDLDGNFIRRFNSIKEAEIATGVSSKHIPSVCTGLRDSAGGYKWEHCIDQRTEIPFGKELPDYPGYIITPDGQVYSSNSKKYLSLKQHASGYISVGLCNGSKQDFYVHVLVATLYLERIIGKDVVNHKDRDKSNNKVENLEWVSSSENTQHAIKTGTNLFKKGVYQCDMAGNVIKSFVSVKEASIATGIDSSSIVRVCRNKQGYAGNFKWKYI